MDCGLETYIVLLIRKVLFRHDKVERALLFGSRAKGTYEAASDIDLAVFGAQLTEEDVLDLAVDLDDQYLIYRFDLVRYEGIKEQALREHIDRVGLLFYDRPAFERSLCPPSEDWKSSTLSALAEISFGRLHAAETLNTKGDGLPLIQDLEELGEVCPKPAVFTTAPKQIAAKGDLLMWLQGLEETGKLNWADRDYAIGNCFAALRHKAGEEYQAFLWGLLEFHLDNLLAIVQASPFPGIARHHLQELPVFVPPMPVQLELSQRLGLHERAASYESRQQLLERIFGAENPIAQ